MKLTKLLCTLITSVFLVGTILPAKYQPTIENYHEIISFIESGEAEAIQSKEINEEKILRLFKIDTRFNERVYQQKSVTGTVEECIQSKRDGEIFCRKFSFTDTEVAMSLYFKIVKDSKKDFLWFSLQEKELQQLEDRIEFLKNERKLRKMGLKEHIEKDPAYLII